MFRSIDSFCRATLALSAGTVVAIVLGLAILGAAVGMAFPKWSAEALLETPGILTADSDAREKQQDKDAAGKTQYVTLSEFRKVLAAYSTEPSLQEFQAATKVQGAAANRLLAQSSKSAFWTGVASPVLPFSRRDAREFGDLKDAASNALVGIDLKTDARTGPVSEEMLAVMGEYFKNALIRERIRAWILRHGGEAPAMKSALQAEIIDSKAKIDAMGRRIQDFKAILARYPDAGKIDARQVVTITEGSDRFLSPLVQLIAAETSITQLRETIARKERQVRQLEFQQRYFDKAAEALDATPLVASLIPELAALATRKFDGVDENAEWAREVVFRIQADVNGFATAQKSFGVRREPRLAQVASRDPLRLAAMGAGAGVLLLGLIAFLRASLRAVRTPGESGEQS